MPQFPQPFLEAWKQSGRIIRASDVDEAPVGFCSIDLSEYQLNLSDATPVLWEQGVGALPVDPEEAAYVLSAAVQRISRQSAVALLLVETESTLIPRYLPALTPTHFLQLDRARQCTMLTGLPVELQLLEAIRDAVPLAELSPYRVGGEGVTGGCFFDRGADVRKILSHPGSSYAVTGARRIGKTSLLKEARRLLERRGEIQDRLVYIDCSTLDTELAFSHRLVRVLHTKEVPALERSGLRRFDLAYFLERMKKMHKGTVTLLLDEFDRPLTYAHAEVDVRAVLRSGIASGAIRVLAAGFEVLAKELRTQTSPLFMLLDEIPIGLFSKGATREMILGPLTRLRVRIDSPDALADTLHALTRGHPLYLQYLCSRLLDECDAERRIAPADIHRIARSHATRLAIMKILEINTEQSDYRLLQEIAATSSGSFAGRGDERLGSLIDATGMSENEIVRRCERLAGSGFMIAESGVYEFTVPLMLESLRGSRGSATPAIA